MIHPLGCGSVCIYNSFPTRSAVHKNKLSSLAILRCYLKPDLIHGTTSRDVLRQACRASIGFDFLGTAKRGLDSGLKPCVEKTTNEYAVRTPEKPHQAHFGICQYFPFLQDNRKLSPFDKGSSVLPVPSHSLSLLYFFNLCICHWTC